MIVAFPAAIGVTSPVLLTVATSGLLDSHVTSCSVVFAGVYATINNSAGSPSVIVRLSGVTLISVIGITASTTVTVISSKIAASSLQVALMIVLPIAPGVTVPSAPTIAILGSSEVQTIF